MSLKTAPSCQGLYSYWHNLGTGGHRAIFICHNLRCLKRRAPMARVHPFSRVYLPNTHQASSSAGDFSRMPMAPATWTCPAPLQPSSRLGLRLPGDDCHSRGPETVSASRLPSLRSARAAHTATPVGRPGLPWMCDPRVVLPSGARTGQSHTCRVYIPEPLSPTRPVTGTHTPLPVPRPSGASPRLRPLWTMC